MIRRRRLEPADQELEPADQEEAGPTASDLREQLIEAAELHDSGFLSDEEFTARKALILGI